MTTQGIVVSSKITREESLKPKEISRHLIRVSLLLTISEASATSKIASKL